MADGIDFSKYQLDELGNDVRSIVDIPGAIGQAAKYALTLPVVVAVITWLVFRSRMAGWVRIPFTFGAFMLAFAASLVIGGYFVARTRLDTVADASGRVVGVMSGMHADVAQIRDGHANTSVQQVAVGLLENAIFPAVFGSLPGPLAFASRAPMKLVQKSVISAVESLPDREIGQLVDNVGKAVPDAAERIDKLATDYSAISGRLEDTVTGVARTALRSMFGLTLLASVPLVAWLTMGWLLS